MEIDREDCCLQIQLIVATWHKYPQQSTKGRRRKFQTSVIQKNRKFGHYYHLPSLKMKRRRKEGAERGCVQIWLIVANWHIPPQQSTKNRKFRHHCHLPSLQVKRRKREGAERGKVTRGDRNTRYGRNTRAVEKRCYYAVVTISFLWADEGSEDRRSPIPFPI